MKGATKGGGAKWAITSISIHTPAKGVTTPSRKDYYIRSISIHTPAKGATLLLGSDVADDAVISIHTPRSEEHTSELQSRENLVCRLLLEKKKKTKHA